MLPLIGAAIAGLAGLGASAVGAVGAGALGLAGLGVQTVGGITSGIGSLLFGGPAAGVTVGQQMAAMAQPAYYETAGVLGGVTAAASSTAGYLSEIAPAAVGLYQVFKPPEQKVLYQAPGTTPSVSAPDLKTVPLPIFSQQPAMLTIGKSVEPEKQDNNILYIGLALLALFLLRKK